MPFGSPAERTAASATRSRSCGRCSRARRGRRPGSAQAAPNQPPPAQPGGPPILLAAHKPRLLRLVVVERADGIVAAFVGADEVAQRLSVADEARRAAGRPPLRCALYTFVLPLTSRREAEAWLRPEAEALDTTPRSPLRWLRGTGIVAPPDEVPAELARLGEAGVTDAALAAVAGAARGARRPRRGGAGPARGPCVPAPAAARSARAGENLVELLVERHAEGGLADSEAAVDDSGAWTFAELSEAAGRAGGALVEAGARRGDRVAIALRDGRPWLAAFLGTARIGAVAVPLDPAAGDERLADVLDDCEPTVIVAEPDRDALPGPTRIDRTRSTPAGGRRSPQCTPRTSRTWSTRPARRDAPRGPCTPTRTCARASRPTRRRCSGSAPATAATPWRACSRRSGSATASSASWPRRHGGAVGDDADAPCGARHRGA